MAPDPKRSVHEATVDYLDERAEHDETEDMHPSRLDEKQASLEDALDAEGRAKLARKRDARDAA